MSSEQCVLQSRDGLSVALKSVHVLGRLDGLGLGVKIRQTYRNETGKNLETVYTFPLAWGATLMGLHVEIAGKRRLGAVIEKKQATQRFEKAIEEGDTPVLVERSASGLYTANLGNLPNGEEATIEIDYAQLLRYEQGHVRLNLPTTIAPRFGEAHRSGGLAPHESAVASPLLTYPMTLEMNIVGAMAQAQLRCPSHKVRFAQTEGGVNVHLDQGGWLDRDFILTIDGLEAQSFALASPDGDQTAVLASFCPQFASATGGPSNGAPSNGAPSNGAPLSLKILVDCSGSMQGDSIEQARRALHEVAQSLQPTDWVSYSKFGNHVAHVIPRLEPCTPFLVGNVLAKAIHHTEADMGGTELHQALQATLDIPCLHGNETSSNLLLITDSNVWNIDSIVAEALRGQHRVFAVGVGSAPAESLLRQLAEHTGGACELVSPKEHIAGAIVRMFHRMREGRRLDVQIDWGDEPTWQSVPPRFIVPGETIHLFATLPTQAGSRLKAPVLRLESKDQGQSAQTPVLNVLPVPSQGHGTYVARLAGAQRLKQTKDKPEALALALRYQLVSDQTSLFLVHERAPQDKFQGLPQLQQIEQMMAAGWGGFGTVTEAFEEVRFCMSSASPDFSSAPVSAPRVWHTHRMQPALKIDALSMDGIDDVEIPAFLRKQTGAEPLQGLGQGLGPAEFVQAFNDAALRATVFDDALQAVLARGLASGLLKAMKEVAHEVGSEAIAWALLLDWLALVLPADCALWRHSERLVHSVKVTELTGREEAVTQMARQAFEPMFPKLTAERWGLAPVGSMGGVLQRVKGLLANHRVLGN